MLSQKGLERWNALRIGLVLSGGGAKGAYEAGALCAMLDLDLADKVYGISGTSVGALNLLVFTMRDRELMEQLWTGISFGTVVKRKNREDRSGVLDIIREIAPFINVKDDDSADDTRDGIYTQAALRDILNSCVDIAKLRANPADMYACAYDIDGLHTEYFDLKKLSDAEIIDAALASSAIPYVYDPVTIGGRRYADGGINDPVYGVKNSDVTPIYPLQDKGYDMLIVIHLKEQDTRGLTHIGKTRVLNIYPSKALEPVSGTGTMMFTQSSIRNKIELGYADMAKACTELLMEYLKA